MTYITSDADGVDTELGEKIREALERQFEGFAMIVTGQEQWADATYDLAINLTKARDRFPANQDFSDWLEAQGINITKDDRAALIAMGREPERARKVLNETSKTSVRRIYNEEFRLRSPANSKAYQEKMASSHTPAPSSQGKAESLVNMMLGSEHERKWHAAENLKALDDEVMRVWATERDPYSRGLSDADLALNFLSLMVNQAVREHGLTDKHLVQLTQYVADCIQDDNVFKETTGEGLVATAQAA